MPDTMVGQLGLTGLPFINVMNGCATGGSALLSACNDDPSRAWRHRLGVGFDKHPRGAFDADPASGGLGEWYGDVGLMLTTQFFAMKINRYMHDHGITDDDAGEGGGQELPQRRAEPERMAAEADRRGGDPRIGRCSTTR